MSSPYDDGRAGRSRDDLQWNSFKRNDHEAGRNMQRLMDGASSGASGSGGVAHTGPMTLRSCLGGIAFLILLPAVVLALAAVGVGVYEERERKQRFEDARAARLWSEAVSSAPRARATGATIRPNARTAKQPPASRRKATTETK